MSGIVYTYDVKWYDETGLQNEHETRVAIGDTSVGRPTTFSDIPRILQIKNGVAERDIVIVSAHVIAAQIV